MLPAVIAIRLIIATLAFSAVGYIVYHIRSGAINAERLRQHEADSEAGREASRAGSRARQELNTRDVDTLMEEHKWLRPD